jgi:hypothetical protein
MFTVMAAVIVGIIELFQWFWGPPAPPPQKLPAPPMTPQELSIVSACLAAGLLTACAYVPFFAAPLVGKTAGALIAESIRTPLYPPASLVVWLVAVGVGAVYLMVGLRGAADGTFAGLWAFWSAALPIIGGVVLAQHAPGLLRDPLGCGVCLVVTAICAMRCYLALRGGKAQRAVRQNINRRNAPMRPARRRRWLFF